MIAEHVQDRQLSLESDYELLADKTRDILAQKKLAELVERWRQDLFVDIRL
jgi:hypothetical protein